MKTDAVDACKLAENLGMSPQEEGGLVKENHYPFEGPGRAGSGHAYYYFRPDVSTVFHTLDCDEYWVYHAGDDLEVWIIDPEGKLERRKFGTSDGAELCLYLKKGVAFAARPLEQVGKGTLISAITVPRFSYDGFHLLDQNQVIGLCPDAEAFFMSGRFS
ncbi:MAG: cupin domain-containing protein [Oscillospiraceae bacterium]|nr:cupin domain-containing protein [Oscillospiraceae bacterium]